MHRTKLLVLVPLLALVGCGPADPSPNDGGGDTGADTPSGFRGFVMIERWERADPARGTAIAASITFHDEHGPVPRYVQLDEHCGYHEGVWSPAADEPDYGEAHFMAPRVGDVVFTSGGRAPGGFEAPAGLAAWDTGDEVRVVAPGGALPGFDLSDTVPARALLTSIDLERVAGNSVTIPRTEPFELAWEPTTDEVFAFFLQFYDDAELVYGVWCFFPGESGAASIPTEALSHLASSEDIPMTNFYFSGASRQRAELEGVSLQMITWNGRSARVLVE